MHSVQFEWIRGHSGHPENERCDKLAVAAAGGSELAIDTEYERAHGVSASERNTTDAIGGRDTTATKSSQEKDMEQSKTYIISRKLSSSAAPGLADLRGEKHMSGASPEEVSRVAIDEARIEDECVVITALHWPQCPVGSRNRLSSVVVSSSDKLEDSAVVSCCVVI